jgi:hypothetical protein
MPFEEPLNPTGDNAVEVLLPAASTPPAGNSAPFFSLELR